MMAFAVADRNGLLLCQPKKFSGQAIDEAVKKRIRRLMPSRKEKRYMWLEMKTEGCKVIVTPNAQAKRAAEGGSGLGAELGGNTEDKK